MCTIILSILVTVGVSITHVGKSLYTDISVRATLGLCSHISKPKYYRQMNGYLVDRLLCNVWLYDLEFTLTTLIHTEH